MKYYSLFIYTVEHTVYIGNKVLKLQFFAFYQEHNGLAAIHVSDHNVTIGHMPYTGKKSKIIFFDFLLYLVGDRRKPKNQRMLA